MIRKGMEMEKELKQYQKLNELAKEGGIAILGNDDDKAIPLCELKQAFELDDNIYNRSVSDISVNSAKDIYKACIEELKPETLFLHIGSNDLNLFAKASGDFDLKYSELIKYIKASNSKCRIAIISLANPEGNETIAEMNKHLKYIAQTGQCEYGDISVKKVWNPKETKDVISFVHSIGFVRPLKTKRPVYDLIKMLFCYN